MQLIEIVFLTGLAGVAYAYFGYPALLFAWATISPKPVREGYDDPPGVSVILPVHNEAHQLEARLENLATLDFPPDLMEVLVVSDGSIDRTGEIAKTFAARDPRFRLIEVQERKGKGNALNVGVRETRHPIVVFTDAGVRLEPGSLRALVAPFSDSSVGCTSGEDHVAGGGGEGAYGRYELFLRRLESNVHSIVGASGSIYAQRRELCPFFPEGRAPDFLSVLHVVDRGYRAVTVPAARGTMGAAGRSDAEFRRKVRTLLRGMTVLLDHRHLLNPLRSGRFAFLLASHKLSRWWVPFFLVAMVVANALLLGSAFWRGVAIPHAAFYVLGLLALPERSPLRGFAPARIAAYFTAVNAAIAVAWWRFVTGHRQEVWDPTRR